MSPSAWKNGGRGVTIRWAVVETTLGAMLVAATDKGVCRLSFNEGEADLRARFPEAELAQGGADFATLLRQVIDAVETPGTGQDIPLDVAGTAFQEACWKALRQIPPGETRSYGELAAALGKLIQNPAGFDQRPLVALADQQHVHDEDPGSWAMALIVSIMKSSASPCVRA